MRDIAPMPQPVFWLGQECWGKLKFLPQHYCISTVVVLGQFRTAWRDAPTSSREYNCLKIWLAARPKAQPSTETDSDSC